MGMRLSAAVLSVEMYSALASAHGETFVAPQAQPQPQQLSQKQRPLRHASGNGASAGSPVTGTLSDNLTSAAMLGTVATAAAAATMGLARNQRTSRKTAPVATLLRAFESELGVQDPVGFFDPLGFTSDGSAENFKRRRQTELKHGRISMLATMGYITPEITGKFPGYLSPSAGLKFADIPNGLGAISKVPPLGWAQIVAYGGFCELSQDQSPGTPGAEGDFGFKVLTSSDPEEKTKKLAAELANGRLAMMAIIGMFFQDGLTGSAWGDWSLYTASPLRAFEDETGVQPPFGYWDPLGLSSDGSAFNFNRRREVELKHGRVSMFATIGYMVPEYFRFEGYCSPSYKVKFSEVPNGLAALGKIPALGIFQTVLFLGLVEILLYNEPVDNEPGNYGAGFLGLRTFGVTASNISDPVVRKTKLNAELANGRLAMMAIIGMFFQDGLTGSAWGDWANYTDSPLRAFEEEAGVQPPLGFWDPLGYTKTGDVEAFKRRRETEIKHGRVAMYATIGYIVPEYFRWPGDLSPSNGLSFSEVPNGLAAISKVPSGGWTQIVAFCGFYELSVYPYSGEPGDYGKGLGGMLPPVADPEVRKTKLNAELANGRLAMAAIIGMFFQDGLTGSAWGDWANYTDSPLRAFEDELGVQAPVGFFDPLGLSKDGEEGRFKRRRASEIKHGRIAMLATMGYITPELTGKFPGYLSPSMSLKYEDIPNGLAAVTKVPAYGWFQIVSYCAFCELSQSQQAGTKGQAGDFGFKAITSSDPETLKKKLNSELANGRLAMMAIIGMFFQDGLTGSPFGDWANYTDSPLRAFEEELGVQAPVGFFDPLGLSKDGNIDTFKRRRCSELKHGRIAMLAAMGYITPEITGKFPGYLSPSMGLKFTDIPNGLGAISKVPAVGWYQIGLYMAFCELTKDQRKGTPGADGDLGFKVLTSKDPEKLKRKLNVELANGRLAMMAIIGMFFQDGLTGSAWGSWSNYTDSPLRAFENEIGVQPPVGFWDPVGFTSTGDVAAFQRRRAVEIKHGRVSMFAAMGYITPEYVKLPGYLSPSQGLEYSDMPNGLAAISKVPLSGWAQIISFIGFLELFVNNTVNDEPGNFGKGNLGLGYLGVSRSIEDPELRKKKLGAELANGRLAMMAIIGMFYQDGLTGSAWGDWSLYTDSPLRATR